MTNTPTKLNLGCGNDIREGWVNLDIADLPGVDIVHDLNVLPLPFADESFDEILCLDVLEHVDYPILLKECHRILRGNGRIRIEVPHFSSNNNFVDPTHRNRFSVKTFNFFCPNTYEGKKRGCYYFDFSFTEVASVELSFHRKTTFFWNYLVSPLVNLNQKTLQYYEATGLTYMFPAMNLKVTLAK